jgi:two-component system response regulator VicR
MQKARILIADDEPRYIETMKLNLEARGYEVVAVTDGAAAVERAGAGPLDLIILDVRMPGLNGYEACRRIREFSTVPIIMLTALAEDADKVKGLDLGADDYVTKPFSAKEFLARIRAALRRGAASREDDAPPVFIGGRLRIEYARRRVYLAEQEISLTATEYRLLCHLARSAGKVLSAEHLLENVWGSSYLGETQLVAKVIHRLRQKLEADPFQPGFIRTRPGQGYYLDPST